MHRARVLTIESYPALATWLREALSREPALELVGESSTANEALMVVESLQPTVIIVDLNVPDMSGLEGLTKIVDAVPNASVIALSEHGDRRYRDACMLRGATAVVRKQAMVSELMPTIKEALDARR